MKDLILTISFLMQLANGIAQKATPIVFASSNKASTRIELSNPRNEWTITPSLNPDIWEVIVPKGKSLKCSFFTDKDSISFDVVQGENYDFIVVLNNKDSAYTRIVGVKEPVFFTEDYQKLFDNETITEIPAVYELINVIIALTNTGIENKDLVEHNSQYYTDVINWFEKYKNDQIVTVIDSILKKEWWKFFYLKMDAYAYVFKNNQITKGEVYDRLNFDAISNTIEPLRHQIQQFADKSEFIEFYDQHKGLYEYQINYYKDSINVFQMQNWLNKNFPTSRYNCYKIVFSPLAGGSQSANFFTNNHFSEAHAYINFPYVDFSDMSVSSPAWYLVKGNVLFTELNHAYINPETNKYVETDDFKMAFQGLKNWEADSSAAFWGYPNAYACFNEYMNWALVSLYYLDFMSNNEAKLFISILENNMKVERGFSRFPEFNKMLIALYSRKDVNETVADLYPAIIKWCKEQEDYNR